MMGEFIAFSQHLVMQVTQELCTLLKVTPNTYLELHAMLIYIQESKPTWLVGGISAMPYKLDFTSCAMGECENEPSEPVDLDSIHCTETALGKVSLPPESLFVLGKPVHMHFVSDS